MPVRHHLRMCQKCIDAGATECSPSVFYTSGFIVQPSVLLFTGLDIKVRKARVFQGASAVNA